MKYWVKFKALILALLTILYVTPKYTHSNLAF